MAKSKAISQISITVPATASNLGPGFDVLGMALKLYNKLEVRRLGRGSPDRVEISGEGAEDLPRGNSNLIVQTFKSSLGQCGSGFLFRMNNGIPLSRGLGSSAAARLAGLLAGAAFSRRTHKPGDIVSRACALEGHPDNVVPAFFGGLCGSVVEKGRIDYFRLRTPRAWTTVLCVPDIEVSTKKARRVLPRRVALRDAVFTSSRLALLIAAFSQGRPGWLKVAMRDVLHQPYRRRLVPGMEKAIQAAEKAGAFGAALSGSGPTIIAFAPNARTGRKSGEAMRKVFGRAGVSARVMVLGVDPSGVRVRTSR